MLGLKDRLKGAGWVEAWGKTQLRASKISKCSDGDGSSYTFFRLL